jgi:CubicO group peptidase (beta-lactamase class C family)
MKIFTLSLVLSTLFQTIGFTQLDTISSFKFQQILDKSINNRSVFGTQVSICSEKEVWTGASGNLNPASSFFIASTTKLYLTAVILNYRSRGILALEDTLGKYVSPSLLKGLHVFQGKEYSHEITIRHLLAHTSGLPDYFLGKLPNGNSLYDELTKGNDQS